MRVTPFLMFQGGIAEQAIQFYMTLFPDAEIVSLSPFMVREPLGRKAL